MSIQRVFGSLVVAGLLLTVGASAVVAYSGQVAGQVVINGPDFVIACGYDWKLKAHVTEADTGNPIEGQPVHWEITDQPAGASDTLSETDTVTDAAGNTQTTITVTPNAYGPRTIKATADDVSNQIVLDCEADGLPPTSISTTSTPVDAGLNWMWVLAAGAMLAGFGIIGLRFTRR